MVVTPGKIGEWIKSYLLRAVGGTPTARTAPVVFAERLTDGLALILLALGGLVGWRLGWQVLLPTACLSIAGIALIQYRPFGRTLVGLLSRVPILRSRADTIEALYLSTTTVFEPVTLLVTVGLATVAWLGEGLGLWLLLVGLGQSPTMVLAVQAVFMLSISLVASAILMSPGGLGVPEGGITGLAQFLLDMSSTQAMAATLIIRLCTVWFGVSIGVVALFYLVRRLGLTITQPEPHTVVPA